MKKIEKQQETMQILKNNLVITIPLGANEYCLYKDRHGQWSVNYKIDMSYKGKPPQLGLQVVSLRDKKVIEELKKKLDVFEEAKDGEH